MTSSVPSSQGQPTAREVLEMLWSDLQPIVRRANATGALRELAEHGFAVVSTRPADLERVAEAIYASNHCDGKGYCGTMLASLHPDLQEQYRKSARRVLVALGATVPEQ